MKLFTDRQQGPKPRVITVLDRRVERALAASIRGFSARNAFGIDYPSTCPDGAGFDGTDNRAFEAALWGAVPEMEGWQARAISSDSSDISFDASDDSIASTGAILDALEWLFAHVGESIEGRFHDFYKHHHLSWDRNLGREKFQQAINDIFVRNGLAYEMRPNGQIHRVVEGPDAELFARVKFATGDQSLDSLLEVARRRFFDRDQDAGQRSIEALWDGFERIKTLENPTNKRKSAEAIVTKAAQSQEAKELINQEMLTLTNIGNNWRIRHHEVGKTELGNDSKLRDYLFLRMFSLIRLLLEPQGMLENPYPGAISEQ